MIHRLYTASAADAAVTWICPEDTEITHVKWIIVSTAPIDGGTTRGELSFAATSQHTTNDVVNVVDSVVQAFEAGAAGTCRTDTVQFNEVPGGVPVEAGEKLYVHTSTAGGSMACWVYIYTKARRANKASRFRRS